MFSGSIKRNQSHGTGLYGKPINLIRLEDLATVFMLTDIAWRQVKLLKMVYRGYKKDAENYISDDYRLFGENFNFIWDLVIWDCMTLWYKKPFDESITLKGF